MIKNERQYRITKSETEKLRCALKSLYKKTKGSIRELHPNLIEVQKNALESQIEELDNDLSNYEALASGKLPIIELNSLEDLPKALIQARISKGLTQKELAEKLGMKEQLLQRYEANDFAQVSLSRLIEIAKALEIQIRNDVFLPNKSLSLDSFFIRLNQIGISKDFALKNLLPKTIGEMIGTSINEFADKIIFEITNVISQIYGWTPRVILGSDELAMSEVALGTARFKLPTGTEEKKLSTYTVYAHFLALYLLKATEGLPQKKITNDPEQFRRDILDSYGELSFKSALNHIWDLGIPVLPLNDPGTFHGACWRVDGRNVIVLKQNTKSIDRWLFDLLHEYYHATERPEEKTFAVIEGEEMSDNRIHSEEEQEASLFAGEVILDGKAEKLAELCVTSTKKTKGPGDIRLLKSVVCKIAESERISIGALANYLAFRLSLQGTNWWGTATNLQNIDINPFLIARDTLLKQTNFFRIPKQIRNLFVQALCDEGA